MKTLVRLMVAAMMIGLLAACGGNGSGEQADSGNKEGAVSSDSGEKVTLRVASWRVEEIEAFKQINAKFNEKYPNIEIKYEPIKATEYDSALNTALNTGTGADLYYVRPFDLGANLFKAGHLLEVSKNEVPNLANVSETQQAVYKDENDKLFAVPYIYVSYGFLYNEALFEKHNVSVPKTWDEFYTALKTLKDAGVTPLALGTKDGWVLSQVVSYGTFGNFVGGEDWRKKLLSGETKVTDPKFVDFLGNLKRWGEYMPANFEGIGYTEAQQMFLTDQAAIYPSGSWEIGVFRAQNPDMKLGFFVSPTSASGDKQWVGFNGGAGLGVNPKSKHTKEAMNYIDWLMSDEAQVMTGNLMAGLFPSANVATEKLTDPLAKAWLDAGGAKGENFTIGWSVQKINTGTPGAIQLSEEQLPAVFKGTVSPEDAAKKIQDGLDTWFKP